MIINNVEYKNVPMTFNAVCKLEEMGVSISDLENHVMSAARAYAALCMHKGLQTAGAEIEMHIMNGGTFADIMNPFAEEIEKSGFFQKLSETAAENAIVQTGKTAEKSKEA